jgi:hypothetical protein
MILALDTSSTATQAWLIDRSPPPAAPSLHWGWAASSRLSC